MVPFADYRFGVPCLRLRRQVRMRSPHRGRSAETFNLNCGPVFRALSLRLAEEDQVLVLNVHHIVRRLLGRSSVIRTLKSVMRQLARDPSFAVSTGIFPLERQCLYSGSCGKDICTLEPPSFGGCAAGPCTPTTQARRSDFSGPHPALPFG